MRAKLLIIFWLGVNTLWAGEPKCGFGDLVEVDIGGVVRPVTEARDPGLREYFVAGVDLKALAVALRRKRGRPFASTRPLPVTLPDGQRFVLRYGNTRPADMKRLALYRDGEEIARLDFMGGDGSTDLFLAESYTHPSYRQRGAQRALTTLALGIHPGTRTIQAGLGWTNFQKIAEQVEGAPLNSVKAQEAVLARAMASGKKHVVRDAVRNSPRGRILETLGFEVDPRLVEFTPAAKSHGYGPLMIVQWRRRPSQTSR